MTQLYTDSQSSDRHEKSDDARKKRENGTQSLSKQETTGLRMLATSFLRVLAISPLIWGV